MDILALQRRFSHLLRPVSTAYAALMRLRAARYARFSGYRASCPVISVGNIAWGGTGKTPLVDHLLDVCAREGVRAVVLTRGYGASPPRTPHIVQPGDEPSTAGDEPLMLARRHPRATVIVDPVRRRAAAWAERVLRPDLFILDDGMQHLSMDRDLDIVLLRPDDLLDGWNRVQPQGAWREGAEALARADAFCIKAEPAAFASLAVIAERRLAALGRPLFSFSLRPTGLVPLDAAHSPGDPPAPGEAYVLVCATGDPAQVERTAATALGPASESLVFPDHHAYTPDDARALSRRALPVVCTAKDAVKLQRLLSCIQVPVWVMEVKPVFGPALFTIQDFDSWWTDRIAREDRS